MTFNQIAAKFAHASNKRSVMKNQRGVTLMELIAGLAVMAVVVVGAVALYGSATSSEKSTTMQRDLGALQAAARQIFNGQGTYGPPGTNIGSPLVTANKIPSTLAVSGSGATTKFVHRDNGDITIASTGNSFSMTVTTVSADLCVPLMTNAAGWTSVKAGSADARTSFPISPTNAETDCKTGTTMVFTN